MTITAVKTLDPVTVEIIRNALTSAADDMNATLIRSAYSPILYEGGDCVVALVRPLPPQIDRSTRPNGGVDGGAGGHSV